MKVLLSNDDGINALGLYKLAMAFKERGHDVTIVAPDSERSATGHAITVHHPLRVLEHNLDEIKGFAISGTPADCVKLALDTLVTDVDIVLAGINRGPNLGTDVLYSGTVSAAIEASLDGYPAVAASLASFEKHQYDISADFLVYLAEKYLEHSLPQGTLLNVNIPNTTLEKIKGVKITKLGERKYYNNFDKRTDPRGGAYYWLAGKVDESNPQPETDVWAILNGFISITPLHFDLTNHHFLQVLADWKLKI
ncbi:MAG: 5'/3'-nucleotidase SurE [Bacillota bacterium]|nr:5'/3'-nucleotidase SurE [Bacillota bacterium]